VCRRFTEEMEPNPQFYQEREALRRRLEDGLVAKGVVPPGTQLNVFGSTANGFGAAGQTVFEIFIPVVCMFVLSLSKLVIVLFIWIL
jgi:hypothetical protein